MGAAHVAEGGTAVKTLACPCVVCALVAEFRTVPPFLLNRHLDVGLPNVSNGANSGPALGRKRVLANGRLLAVHLGACQLAFVDFKFAAGAVIGR